MRSPLIIMTSAILIAADIIGLINLIESPYLPLSINKTKTDSITSTNTIVFSSQNKLAKEKPKKPIKSHKKSNSKIEKTDQRTHSKFLEKSIEKVIESQNRYIGIPPFTEKTSKQIPKIFVNINLRKKTLLKLNKKDRADINSQDIVKLNHSNKTTTKEKQKKQSFRSEAAAKKKWNDNGTITNATMAVVHRTKSERKSTPLSYLHYPISYPSELNQPPKLAKALALIEKFDETKKSYPKSQEMDLNNLDTIIKLGYILFNQGDLDQAEKILKSAHNLNPKNPKIQKAIKAINKRKFDIHKNHKVTTAWENAETFFQNNFTKKAIETLKNILKVYPSEPATRFHLANMYLKSGSPKKALDIFDRLTHEFPKNVDFLISRALTQVDLKNQKKAEADLLLAKKLAPGNWKVKNAFNFLSGSDNLKNLDKDIANLEILGQYHTIIERLEQEIKNHPEKPNLQFMLAQFQSSAGKTEDAVGTYDNLLMRYPDNFDYLLGRALTLKRFNQIKRAKKDLLKALKIKSGNNAARIGLGTILVTERKLLEGAEQFEEVLKNDPDNSDALESLREIESFTKDRLTKNTFVETFSNRTSRFNSNIEWTHPIKSTLRSKTGALLLKTGDTIDITGFLGGDWDYTPNWSLGVRTGLTPSNNLFPRHFHEGKINYLIPKTETNLSVLYRYMGFQPNPFHYIIPSITFRISDNFTSTAHAYLGFQNQGNTHAGQLKLDYAWNPELTSYIGGTYGTGGSRITTNQETTPADVYSIQTGFQYRLSKLYAVRFNYEYENRKGQFKRNIFGLQFPFWF